jgi:serine/threonine protein kinase
VAGENPAGEVQAPTALGSGRFGPIYAAKHAATGTWHRVQLLERTHDDQVETKELYTDVSAAMLLQHPRIVRITEVGVEDGQPFVVSDLVEGSTLGDWLARRRREAEGHIAGWLRDIAAALDFAHERGVAHLDLKPSSIVIRDGDLVALVADFGHPTGAAGARLLGAPEYTAPEQWRHDRALIGPASDVYMFSAFLFELVAGQPPFGSGPGAMRGHLDRPAPELRLLRPDLGTASELDRILASGLAKSPSQRPESVGALVDAFISALEAATLLTADRSQQSDTPPNGAPARLSVDPVVVGGVVTALGLAALWLLGR